MLDINKTVAELTKLIERAKTLKNDESRDWLAYDLAKTAILECASHLPADLACLSMNVVGTIDNQYVKALNNNQNRTADNPLSLDPELNRALTDLQAETGLRPLSDFIDEDEEGPFDEDNAVRNRQIDADLRHYRR